MLRSRCMWCCVYISTYTLRVASALGPRQRQVRRNVAWCMQSAPWATLRQSVDASKWKHGVPGDAPCSWLQQAKGHEATIPVPLKKSIRKERRKSKRMRSDPKYDTDDGYTALLYREICAGPEGAKCVDVHIPAYTKHVSTLPFLPFTRVPRHTLQLLFIVVIFFCDHRE